MKYAAAGQVWGTKYANRKFQNIRYYDADIDRDVIVKELIPETRRGRKILRGMIENGWVVRDITKTWGRAMVYTLNRPPMSPEAAKTMGWQA